MTFVLQSEQVAARRQVAVGFSISIGTGILMSLGLYIFGEALVGVFAGSGGEAAKATLSRSLSYVRIRGAGSVPTLIMMVAQAACIGAKDAESPLIAICIVSVFNCFLGTHPALLIRRSRTRLGWNGPLHAQTCKLKPTARVRVLSLTAMRNLSMI